jgi:hypothetical protein
MPLIGRNGVVQINSSGTATTIAYVEDVETSLDQDLIKEYCFGQQNPAILAAGLQSYKVSMKRMFTDMSIFNLVSAGTAMQVIVGPAGTTTGQGNPKITLTGFIMKTWNIKFDQKGVVLENVNGEGQSIQAGTF